MIGASWWMMIACRFKRFNLFARRMLGECLARFILQKLVCILSLPSNLFGFPQILSNKLSTSTSAHFKSLGNVNVPHHSTKANLTQLLCLPKKCVCMSCGCLPSRSFKFDLTVHCRWHLAWPIYQFRTTDINLPKHQKFEMLNVPHLTILLLKGKRSCFINNSIPSLSLRPNHFAESPTPVPCFELVPPFPNLKIRYSEVFIFWVARFEQLGILKKKWGLSAHVPSSNRVSAWLLHLLWAFWVPSRRITKRTQTKRKVLQQSR